MDAEGMMMEMELLDIMERAKKRKRPTSIDQCHFFVRRENTEDGELWAGKCVQFPHVIAYSLDIADAMGYAIDAVQTLLEKGSG